jgi:hypothetical protein
VADTRSPNGPRLILDYRGFPKPIAQILIRPPKSHLPSTRTYPTSNPRQVTSNEYMHTPSQGKRHYQPHASLLALLPAYPRFIQFQSFPFGYRRFLVSEREPSNAHNPNGMVCGSPRPTLNPHRYLLFGDGVSAEETTTSGRPTLIHHAHGGMNAGGISQTNTTTTELNGIHGLGGRAKARLSAACVDPETHVRMS